MWPSAKNRNFSHVPRLYLRGILYIVRSVFRNQIKCHVKCVSSANVSATLLRFDTANELISPRPYVSKCINKLRARNDVNERTLGVNILKTVFTCRQECPETIFDHL